MSRFKKILVGSLATLGLVGTGLSGYALADIPDSSNGTITACRVSGDAGDTRIIDKQNGESCHAYEDEVSWTSTKGVTGYEIQTNAVSIPATNPNNRATVTATCTTGKKVVGGGEFETDGGTGGPNFQTYSSWPDTDHSWSTHVFNNGGSAKTLTVYAICVTP